MRRALGLTAVLAFGVASVGCGVAVRTTHVGGGPHADLAPRVVTPASVARVPLAAEALHVPPVSMVAPPLPSLSSSQTDLSLTSLLDPPAARFARGQFILRVPSTGGGYLDYCATNGVTCHYVLAGGGASGTTGADWAHACNGFTGSCAVSAMTRGHRYYTGTGSYAALTLDKAESGTTLLTVIGAIATDHGTQTGWSSSFGVDVTQATFAYSTAGGVIVNSGYWVFDGNTGHATIGNVSASLASFGFNTAQPANCADLVTFSNKQTGLTVGNSGATVSTVTFAHVSGNGCSQGGVGSGLEYNAPQLFINTGCGACDNTNITIDHVYAANFGDDVDFTNTHNSTLQNFYFEKHHYSGSNSGKEPVNLFCNSGVSENDGTGLCDSNTIRWGLIRDVTDTNGVSPIQTGCIVGIGGNSTNVGAMTNYAVYGITFVDCAPNSATIGAANFATVKNSHFYNLTFVRSSHLFQQCEADCTIAGGNVWENNLNYTSDSVFNGAGGSITHDYNAYCSPTDTPPTETHGQTGCGDLFVASGSNDFHLATDTTSGLTLASPYTTDPDGVTRGVNGTWDRGAYQKTN